MASREENEAVAGLLRRSLARNATSSGCPEPEFLAEYFEHSLDAAETARYDRHFFGCSRCREQLAAMVRADAPKAHSPSAWLLDWRLLSAAATAMVLVTVWLVRGPEKLAPVSQPASAPVVATNKEQPKSESAATIEPDEVTRAPQSPQRGGSGDLKVAPSNPMPPRTATNEARADEKKATEQFADSDSLETKPALSRDQRAAPSGERTFAQVAGLKRQNVLAGQAGGVGSSSTAKVAGHATAAQQQIPSASQMVAVQPEAPQTQTASAPSQSTSQLDREAPPAAANAGGIVGGVTQTVTNGDISKESQQQTAEVASAYSASNQAASLQTLAERSVEKVIDTPIPSVKWRITAAGFVERSEDGGATWKGQEPDPDAHLVAGSAPTDKVCWLVGREGIVLVTKDAANWKKIPPPVTADLTAVSAKNASAATVTTADGRRFSTHNEGKKWKAEN